MNIVASQRLETAPPRKLHATARGHCRPFGATPRPDGINFAVFSRHAHKVHLILFKEGREEPVAEITLDPAINKTGDVWHIFVYDLTPDYLYGYRVFGPNDPKTGPRFNSTSVLLDPYACGISGGHPWGSHDIPHGQKNGRLTRRSRIVINDFQGERDYFDWQGDVPPRIPLDQTIIYELHVRGYTRHPSSGVRHPGTYLGLCEKIPYLKSLGVTAVQLMPTLEFDELEGQRKNPAGELLKNYWGYSPLSFFAPKAGYAAEAGKQLREFKQMVKAFHSAGMEVILDVVYNHTCEGNEHGPTLNFRGLDNAVYYMLDPHGHYYNFTGCGNTLNCNHPVVRDLIIESLTYLTAELHVDGFRFDLATILGRGPDGKILEDPPLIRHIAEHPVLADTKLLAEAWDAAGVSQLGKFPAWGRWAEFNGWFRDDVRRFVRSDANTTMPVAKRICGSMDLYGDSSRHPYHSLNFITCHDGFTLHDLVSYNQKHNQANGENNRDGWDWNFSWNCGHEGPTSDHEVLALRRRQIRNFLTLLFISQGVPVLLHGDEFGRTQQGNNNAYCQDNEISWVDWTLTEKNEDLLRFTRLLIALRKEHFSMGREEFADRVTWHGAREVETDWSGKSHTLAFHLSGNDIGPDIYVMLNSHWEPHNFTLPERESKLPWRRVLDTSLPSPHDIVSVHEAPQVPRGKYAVGPRSSVILI